LMRGRAVAARRAHNPEVRSSNLLPATIFKTTINGRFWFKTCVDFLNYLIEKRNI
jgi:hypothetical protein